MLFSSLSETFLEIIFGCFVINIKCQYESFSFYDLYSGIQQYLQSMNIVHA
jgi:hypothetical protein